jgi:hypothetical protein
MHRTLETGGGSAARATDQTETTAGGASDGAEPLPHASVPHDAPRGHDASRPRRTVYRASSGRRYRHPVDCPQCGAAPVTHGLLTTTPHTADCPRRLPDTGPPRPFTRGNGVGAPSPKALVGISRAADTERRNRPAPTPEPEPDETDDQSDFGDWLWSAG